MKRLAAALTTIALSGCAASAAFLESVDVDRIVECGEAGHVAAVVTCLGLEKAKAAHRAAGMRCVREVKDLDDGPSELDIWEAARAVKRVERLRDGEAD